MLFLLDPSSRDPHLLPSLLPIPCCRSLALALPCSGDRVPRVELSYGLDAPLLPFGYVCDPCLIHLSIHFCCSPGDRLSCVDLSYGLDAPILCLLLLLLVLSESSRVYSCCCPGDRLSGVELSYGLDAPSFLKGRIDLRCVAAAGHRCVSQAAFCRMRAVFSRKWRCALAPCAQPNRVSRHFVSLVFQ